MSEQSLFEQAWLGQGWEVAVPDLQGPGRRWLLSPWISTESHRLHRVLRPGDRLLIRGKAADFLSGMSNLEPVIDIAARGVEVRRLPHLHAKVYVREQEGQGVLWLGSANLSFSGQRGQLSSPQVEAMSGPHPLNDFHLEWLETAWGQAEEIEVAELQSEVRRLQEEQAEKRLFREQSSVVAVTLSFRLLSGQHTIRPEALGHTTRQALRNRVKYPSIDYLNPKASEVVEELRRYFRSERRKFEKNVQSVPGVKGMYVVSHTEVNDLKAALARAEREAVQRFGSRLQEAVPELRRDFKDRFEDAVQKFLPQSSEMDHQLRVHAATEALEHFDTFAAKNLFAIDAHYFLPLLEHENEESRLQQIAASLEARQSLFADGP